MGNDRVVSGGKELMHQGRAQTRVASLRGGTKDCQAAYPWLMWDTHFDADRVSIAFGWWLSWSFVAINCVLMHLLVSSAGPSTRGVTDEGRGKEG